MPTCAATADDGFPCRAPPRGGSPYCFWHDPSLEAERAAASAKGGRAPRRPGIPLPEDLSPPKYLDDPMKIASILESMIGAVISGKASVAQAKAVAYMARTMLAALEQGDVRVQLDELRAAIRRLEEGGLHVTR